ncbi:hypothetical protein F511_29966 [Dorcoceras hygrometricum]|uniref:Uncharacterized protein n=1 Tax=Dorcoceras hygrometricum TaxID=472368 RepID=A0A2Z7AKD6_9LAMI|nr:hypothetical protein F511_29966 [Dorcoceras hygrometricum]
MSASGESSTTMHRLLHASGSHPIPTPYDPKSLLNAIVNHYTHNENSIGYPRMSASGESSTTMHRLLHASGSYPIPPPDDPKTNQYNQDLGLIHSTNGNHLESPNEGSSIDHQSNAIIGVMTTGFECLPPSCDGLTDPEDHGPMISTG